jgi:hypothetical protein
MKISGYEIRPNKIGGKNIAKKKTSKAHTK